MISSSRADTSPVVVAARTPIGTAGHAFATVTAADLAAPVLAARCPTRHRRARCDDVVLGNCMGPGGDVARVSALAAGSRSRSRR